MGSQLPLMYKAHPLAKKITTFYCQKSKLLARKAFKEASIDGYGVITINVEMKYHGLLPKLNQQCDRSIPISIKVFQMLIEDIRDSQKRADSPGAKMLAQKVLRDIQILYHQLTKLKQLKTATAPSRILNLNKKKYNRLKKRFHNLLLNWQE